MSNLTTLLTMSQLGRCGSGAVQLAKDVGIPDSDIVRWDIEETKKGQLSLAFCCFRALTSIAGGPFREIVEDVDILVNCIYLSAQIPPFVTPETLTSPNRRLSVICDVSADT